MENQLANYHFNLDINSVLNFMGYAEPERARPKIRVIAEGEMARANDFADSWGCALQTALCGINEEDIYLKKGDKQVCLHSQQLPKILKKADAVSIILVTAGRKISDESRRLMAAGKMTQALAVSAVGSAMVVDLMKELTRQVFVQAQQRNYGTTIRVGPGYTGWHLNDQSTLFSFFDQNTADLPITLNHGIMMEPEKSLLGMVGLVPDGKEAPEIEPCRICDLKGCDMRKAPFRGFDGQGKAQELKGRSVL
jgi:hypothetical protein